jgi:GDP-4-dehydro-6-deoxy-D-mannose reductase
VRALVTGATGFVGTYLVAALEAGGDTVLGCGGPRDDRALPIDLSDPSSIRAAFDLAQPDIVFHLAARTFVPDSFASPHETYAANVLGTANVVQAMRDHMRETASRVRLVFTSSAEVYGTHAPREYPLRETAELLPPNPYAASKAAAEVLLLSEMRAYGLDVVIARAFNHIGPGQSDRFVVSSFASQLASIAGGAPPILHVGNLEAKRDFLDVRDVVEAYVALAERGVSGEIYNVCSGVPHKVSELLRELIIAAHVPVEVREDPERMRPSDTPLSYGDNTKLKNATGWEPRIALTRSIRDIYEAARMKGAP